MRRFTVLLKALALTLIPISISMVIASGCGLNKAQSSRNQTSNTRMYWNGPLIHELAIPDLTCMTYQLAQQAAKEHGFKVSPPHISTKDGSRLYVQSQYPPAGDSDAKGATIQLLLVSHLNPIYKETQEAKEQADPVIKNANVIVSRTAFDRIPTIDIDSELRLVEDAFNYYSSPGSTRPFGPSNYTPVGPDDYHQLRNRAQILIDECNTREKAKSQGSLEVRMKRLAACRRAIDEAVVQQVPGGLPDGAPGPGKDTIVRLCCLDMNDQATEATGEIECVDRDGIFRAQGIGVTSVRSGESWQVTCHYDDL